MDKARELVPLGDAFLTGMKKMLVEGKTSVWRSILEPAGRFESGTPP